MLWAKMTWTNALTQTGISFL